MRRYALEPNLQHVPRYEFGLLTAKRFEKLSVIYPPICLPVPVVGENELVLRCMPMLYWPSVIELVLSCLSIT